MSRLPSTGPSLLRHIRQQDRQALRQAQSSAFTRSGASVSNPGMLSSDDFDGVDRTHLGTSGWALGSFDGGPSYLVLNGLDVYAKLTAKDAELAAMQADLAAAVADIAAQQASLTAQLASINALIGQQTHPDAGNAASGTVNPMPATGGSFATITFNVPAGYTVASVVGNSSALVGGPIGSAQVMTRIAGLNGPSMDVYAIASSNVGNGSSNFSRVFSVTPGGTFTVETYVVSPNGGAGRFTTAASVTFSR